MPVHNHGPEDGAGLACRETVISGRLVGACLLPLAEANRTLARLVELAPKVAPDVSGHDGFYFTHGYDTAEERAAAAEALSLVEHALGPAVARLEALHGYCDQLEALYVEACGERDALAMHGGEDTARLDWLDTLSVRDVGVVHGYMADGNSARHSIDLVRGAEQAAPALAVDPVSGTRTDSWSIPPAAASALTPPMTTAANPQEDETDAR